MSVLTPLFLVGLAGILIPVLIHIFTRDRIRRVAFSTMRFFAKASRTILRKKKLREAILLAMRMLACALLALAFARPFLEGEEDTSLGLLESNIVRAIVVDLSGSMARARMPDMMRTKANEALEGLSKSRDAAVLISFDDNQTLETPTTKKLDDIRDAIRALKPGSGGTNIAEALRNANILLQPVKALEKEIVLVSDLQHSGWDGKRISWKLSPGVSLRVLPVEIEGSTANLAIVKADYPHSIVSDKSQQTITVRLTNYSNEDIKNVQVTMFVKGKKVESKRVSIRQASSVAVRFMRVFDDPGDNLGRITAEFPDAVPADNTFYFNVRVIPKIKVLVLNGRPSPNPLKDAAFFLETALTPIEESPFRVHNVKSTKVSLEDFNDVQVAILSNVGSVPSPVRKALSDLLQRGGGVLYLPGDQVREKYFKKTFGELAPCGLRRILMPQTSQGEAIETSLTRIDYNHPALDIFLRPHHGDLSTVKFVKFWEVTDSQISRVLARFDDGRPAILEREIGKGLSIMLASPIDLRWNDLPLKAIFLPYLHQTVRYLAVRTEHETEYTVGDRLSVPEEMRIKDPKGSIHESASFTADVPGFHAAVEEDGKQRFVYAVNLSPDEANPATISSEEIVASLEMSLWEREELAVAESKTPDADEGKDSNLWWYALAALIMLLMAELTLGNKTARH